MNDEMGQFKNLYFQTAKEQVAILKENLSVFPNSTDPEVINKIFIAAHSLKGQSIMMGYEYVGRSSQAIEKIFRGLKEGRVQKAQVNIGLVTATIDKISVWLTAGGESTPEPDLHQEIADLEKLQV